MKDKKWNIFSWLKEIIFTKSDYKSFTPEQWKTFDSYLINLFLSMNPDYVELVDELQEIEFNKKNYIEYILTEFSNVVPNFKTRTFKTRIYKFLI